MAKSLNRVTLIGNLGADPELRTTPQGMNVVTVSIATTESYKDKNDAWQEATEWHRVVLWNRLADIAKEYLKKGSKVYIEGRLKTSNYVDKDNITRYSTDVVASNLIMMGGSSSSSADSPKYDTSVNVSTVNESHEEYNAGNDEPVDDIPF
jgi:single-strand DNA-binding protein